VNPPPRHHCEAMQWVDHRLGCPNTACDNHLPKMCLRTFEDVVAMYEDQRHTGIDRGRPFIAHALGVCTERVRQLEERAIVKLRSRMPRELAEAA